MKSLIFLGLLLAASCLFPSCEQCNEKPVYRPALSADALEWVQVADTAPYFKITKYNSAGQIENIDTIQGFYTKIVKDSTDRFTECSSSHFKYASNTLSLKKGQWDLGTALSVDNYSSSKDYSIYFERKDFKSNTLLDTVTILGKKYDMVLKKEIGSDYAFYYAKGIGLIYSQLSFKVELLP